MLEKLAALLNIDKSDPSTGIKISLKPRPADPRLVTSSPAMGSFGDGGTGRNDTSNDTDNLLLPTPPPPHPPTTGVADAVHIVNGRVVRESRHTDSSYSNWAPI